MADPEGPHSEVSVPATELQSKTPQLQAQVEQGLLETGEKADVVGTAISETRAQLEDIAGRMQGLDEAARKEVTDSVVAALKPLADALRKGDGDRERVKESTLQRLRQIAVGVELTGAQVPREGATGIDTLLKQGQTDPESISVALAGLQAVSVAETSRHLGNSTVAHGMHKLENMPKAA